MSSRSRRPLFPPLPLDPISDIHPSDILSRDSSSSDSDSEAIAKRARMLKHAESYLRGEQLYLHSARLRGPVVKNPWGKGGRQTKRKVNDILEGVGKRLKCGGEEREISPTPTQSRGGIAMDAETECRGPSSPSTPTPLRTRPPEATNVPDHSYSLPNSPYDKEALEFKTPVKKKPKNPIEVAPAFSPGTFYTKSKLPQPSTKTLNRRRSSSAKKSSPPQEIQVSASRSASAQNSIKELEKVPEKIPESSLEVRGQTPGPRSSRRSTKVPTPETPQQARSSSSKPRSTRNSTKEPEPEPELPQGPHTASRRRSTRNNQKNTQTPEPHPPLKQGKKQQSEEKGRENGNGRKQETRILDTIAVAHSPKPPPSDIDIRKKRTKIDFGAKSPIVTASERPKTKGRKKRRAVKGRRPEKVQVEGEEVIGNVGIGKGMETEELQKEAVLEVENTDNANRVSPAGVSEPEHDREAMENLGNEPAPVIEDVGVSAVEKQNHNLESVEATSKESLTSVDVPEREQTPEAPTSSNDPIKEQVLQSWVNRHVAASQSFKEDKRPINRLSISNLLSPMVESPAMRRNMAMGTMNGIPDTPINGREVVMVPNTPAPIGRAAGMGKAPEPLALPPLLEPEKNHPPPSSHAATIDVPRSPDRSQQPLSESAYVESPTQFDPTNPQPETQPPTQQDSMQSTQYALLAAQKGFLDAIQESPVVFGPYLSNSVTPGRDLLKPISFFEDTNSETPGLITSFSDIYRGRGKSPDKTPRMESVQWTAESHEVEDEESPLKTPGHTLSPLKLSFGNDSSPETTFTPFRAFATPESSPKATSQREFSPLTLSSLKQTDQGLSTAKKSVKFANGNGNGFGLLDDDENENEAEDRTTSFDSGFSPIGTLAGMGQQGAEGLVEEVMGFMGGDMWNIDEELRKMAGSSATATPSKKGERPGVESGRKRRAWAKR